MNFDEFRGNFIEILQYSLPISDAFLATDAIQQDNNNCWPYN